MDLEKLKYEKKQKNEMNFINADKNVTSINKVIIGSSHTMVTCQL